MITIAQKSDAELKSDVLSELNYDPGVMATDIGVLVKDGAVTLNGYVPNYWKKWNAVRAAQRVAGVHALADDIEVRLPDSVQRTDGEIASAAAQQIELSSTIETKNVQVTVREGWVTITGEVEWWYQKNAAERAVLHLLGVKGVSNLIAIQPSLSPAEVGTSIESAFRRSAILDAANVRIETSAGHVTLRGHVRNHAEKEEAERAAWAAAGVISVDNRLEVHGSWS
jgi:osmotically-inducible protein OsmY